MNRKLRERNWKLRGQHVRAKDGGCSQQRAAPYPFGSHPLKQAEQFNRRARAFAEGIVNALREPLIVLNESMQVICASKAFCESFRTCPEETLSRSLFEVGDGRWNIPGLRSLLLQGFHGSGRLSDYEVEHVFPDLGHRTILFSGSRLKHDGSESRFFLLAVEDISDRKRMEQERRQTEARERARAVSTAVEDMRAELEQIRRVVTVGELATSIAHEVSQPVACVLTNAQAALNWLNAEPANIREVRQSLELIVRDGKRACEVIRRIRDFVKKTPPTEIRLDLNTVIEESLILAKCRLMDEQIVTTLKLPPNLPRVWGDHIQLQQVILNLVVNAIEAMSVCPDEQRTLTISTAAEGDDHVVVAVSDSGPGLQPETLQRMFGASYTTKATGMGMGLSLSRAIVEALGGRMWATQNEERGAALRFCLRVAKEAL